MDWPYQNVYLCPQWTGKSIFFRTESGLLVRLVRPTKKQRIFLSRRAAQEAFPTPPPPLPPGLDVELDAVVLANALLGINLPRFFDLAASSYLSYRQNTPFTVFLGIKQRQWPERAAVFDKENRSHGIDVKTFRQMEEASRWKRDHAAETEQNQIEFTNTLQKALEQNGTSTVPSNVMDLLLDACRICLDRLFIRGVPDAMYPYKLFTGWASQIKQINRIFEAISRKSGSEQWASHIQAFAALIGGLEQSQHAIQPSHTIINTKWRLSIDDYIELSAADSDVPNISGAISKLELKDVLRAIYSTLIQECLNSRQYVSDKDLISGLKSCIDYLISIELKPIAPNIRNASEIIAFAEKWANHISARLDMRDRANFIIDLVSRAKPLAKILDVSVEEDLAIRNHNWTAANEDQIDYPSSPSLTTTWDGSKNDTDFMFYLSLVERANGFMSAKDFSSFPHFYALLLYSLIVSGFKPKACATCGLPYFPTGGNSRYCNRFNDNTGLYCNPSFNAKLNLGRKSPHNTATNLHRKAQTARKTSISDARYFNEMAEFVDHIAGPLYKTSSLINDALYEEWLLKVNEVNNRNLHKLSYPRPVIWNGTVADGNVLISTESMDATYAAVIDQIKHNEEGRPNGSEGTDAGVSRYDLIRGVINFQQNNEGDCNLRSQIEALSIPGLIR